jgi:hypothetical protein
LPFPTIFCGEKRLENNISYAEICKSELRRLERRVAGHIPNLFFKHKKLQAKHINDKSNLILRKVKGGHKKLQRNVYVFTDIYIFYLIRLLQREYSM